MLVDRIPIMQDNIFVILVALFFTVLAFNFLRSKVPFGDIPGPPSHSWIYGNMLELILYSPYGMHEFEWQKKYGPVYSIKGCIGEDRLMVSDSTALRHILADTGDFSKSPQHQLINKNVFGNGSVLYAHGLKHRRIRAAMSPAFSAGALRAVIPSLQECARHLSENLERRLEPHSFDGVVDVFQDLHHATLQGVSECVMGYDVTTDEEYTAAYENLVITGAKRSKMSILAHSALLALPTWVVDVLKFLPPPDFRTLLKHREVSYRRADTFLDSKIEAQRLGVEPETDLFNVMLETHATKPENLSLEEIKDQFGTITVAGEDTTANALVWALYVISTNQEWQQRLREEVVEAHESRAERSLEFYDRLPFLNALIKEVMRFYSPLPYTERIAIKDTVIPVSQPITTRTGRKITEIPVKKGQYVEIAISSYNRLPSVWGPDAGQFKPTRWLDGTGKLGDGAIGPYSNLLTFLGGPRTCLGWRFAVVEVQIVLCDLIRKFNFSFPQDSVIETAHAISLVPIHNYGKAELPLRISSIS